MTENTIAVERRNVPNGAVFASRKKRDRAKFPSKSFPHIVVPNLTRNRHLFLTETEVVIDSHAISEEPTVME